MSLTHQYLLGDFVENFEKSFLALPKSDMLDALIRVLKDDSLKRAALPNIEAASSADEALQIKEYIKDCRRFLFKLLLSRYYSLSIPITDLLLDYKTLLKRSYWKKFQLGSCYLALFEKLLGYEKENTWSLKLLPSGLALLEDGRHVESLNLPHSDYLPELALVATLHAKINLSPKALENSLVLCQSMQVMLDEEFLPLKGLWRSEMNFSYDATILQHLLMNILSFELSEDEEFARRGEAQLRALNMAKALSDETMSVFILIALLFKDKLRSELAISYPSKKLEDLVIDPKLSFARYQGSHLLACVTSLGFQSGVGLIKKGPLEIITMGPHLDPLGDRGKFGISKVLGVSMENFQDAHIKEIQGHGFSFSSIFSMKSSHAKMGHSHIDHFIHSQLDVLHEKVDLSIKAVASFDVEPLYFVFFVKCPKLIISKTIHLQPNSLDRFKGKVGQIELTNMKSQMKMLLKCEQLAHIIPLAGGDYFFGADFLIAFPLELRSTLSIEVS